MDRQEFSRYGHVFRPGLLCGKRAFWLNGAVLHWRTGNRKGHVALSDITGVTVERRPGGRICRLVEVDGRVHRIFERHWFGWEAGERHRIGTSELRSPTFVSLVSAINRRMRKSG